MANLSQWVTGARPRTLPAAVVPVVVASAGAASVLKFDLPRAILALVVSLALQVGTNFANDYSDGIRGTDDRRVGPARLTASKAARPRAVLTAALIFFALAAVAGFILAFLASWYLLLGGFAALLAGWYYTGGSKPYGYYGFGELFVFVFFGLFAVLGTFFVQVGSVGMFPLLIAVPVGLLAVALLVVNNLRDIQSDMASNKSTLAVRLGDKRTRTLYEYLILSSLLLVFSIALYRPFSLLALFAIFFAIKPVRDVHGGSTGKSLIKVLGSTGRLQITFGLLLSVGVLI